MKIFLLGFYIVFVPLSYGVESAKPLPPQMMYCKQRGKKVIDAPKPPLLSPTTTVICNVKNKKIKDKEQSFFKIHIENMKKSHDDIDKTIQQVENKTPTCNQIAKIIFSISNLINHIDTITASNDLDKVVDVINQSNEIDPITDIYELLYKAKNFLSLFSLSFIENTVKELPVINEFDKKIESVWYKDGCANITKCITMLEKFVELENCREDIMSFFPLVEKTYKQISDTISKMVTSSSKTFLIEASEFLETIKEFSGVLKQIETNTCLVSSTGITQAEEIVDLAKKLYIYFFDLSNKLKEILEEVKVDEMGKANQVIRYYNCPSDGYIQDIIHDIFLCKYNKMFYKQMNNEVSKLLTLIKSLQQIKE